MTNRTRTYRPYALWIRSLSMFLVGVFVLSFGHQTLGKFIHLIEHTLTPPAVILQHSSTKQNLASFKEGGSKSGHAHAEHLVYGLYAKGSALFQDQRNKEGLDKELPPTPPKSQLSFEKHWFFAELPASISFAFGRDEGTSYGAISHFTSRWASPPDKPPKI